MENKQETMIFRIDADLKKAFTEMCREMDSTPSQLMRKMIKGAVTNWMKENSQGTLMLFSDPPKKPLATTEKSKTQLKKIARQRK